MDSRLCFTQKQKAFVFPYVFPHHILAVSPTINYIIASHWSFCLSLPCIQLPLLARGDSRRGSDIVTVGLEPCFCIKTLKARRAGKEKSSYAQLGSYSAVILSYVFNSSSHIVLLDLLAIMLDSVNTNGLLNLA